MNKNDLSIRLAEEVGLTKKDAERVLDALLGEVEKALVAGEEVKLSGFGVLAVKQRKERVGTNPSNANEKITIPATKTVSFKPAKALKEKVA
ncbi:MAG: HU family DNA-binding protein [Bacilli bacterium]|nr:HU family DNA-binding protein [Bacilli bacterium]